MIKWCTLTFSGRVWNTSQRPCIATRLLKLFLDFLPLDFFFLKKKRYSRFVVMPFQRMHAYIPFSALPCLHVLFVKYLRAHLDYTGLFLLGIVFFFSYFMFSCISFLLVLAFKSAPCMYTRFSYTCTNFLNRHNLSVCSWFVISFVDGPFVNSIWCFLTFWSGTVEDKFGFLNNSTLSFSLSAPHLGTSLSWA
jgi:hypothetical protein